MDPRASHPVQILSLCRSDVLRHYFQVVWPGGRNQGCLLPALIMPDLTECSGQIAEDKNLQELILAVGGTDSVHRSRQLREHGGGAVQIEESVS